MPEPKVEPTTEKVETKTEPIELTEKVETEETAETEPLTYEELQAELEETRAERDQAETDRQKEESRHRYQERQTKKEPVVVEQPPKADTEPNPDEYDEGKYDIQFTKDLSSWQRRQDRATEQVTDRQTAFDKQLDKGFEKYEDFGKVGMKVDMSPGMIDALHDMDGAADVAQHLGKNPAEAHRIASLSPIAAAREIGKIAERLTQPPKKKIEPTKAGEPISTITSGAAPIIGPDITKMSYKERTATWEANRLKKAHGK